MPHPPRNFTNEIHVASLQRNYKKLRSLLNTERFEIDSERFTDGRTLYEIAVGTNDVDSVRVLVELGLRVTEDHIAFTLGTDNWDIIALLLHAVSDTDIGCDILDHAFDFTNRLQKCPQIIEMLGNAGVAGFDAIYLVSSGSYAQIARILLKSEAAMMQPRHAPAVQRAADEGHADVLKQLVKAGATPPALSLAICALRGQASVVQYLLSVPGHGPELDDALYYAVSGQHVHIAAALLEARADPNHSFGSSSVLMAAIGRGLPPSATRAGAAEAATRLLLGARARVDVCDGDGASPLMLAAQQGHPRVVELVLAAGGDVHARNGAQSVLSYARGTDVVRVLLQAGAAVDPPGCESVLTPACRHGDAKTVKLLLAAKADLRGLSAAGQPLLHVAVQTQADAAEEAQLETVRLLLSSRAPVQPAAGGASALHLCAAQADALSERVAPLLLAREPEALEYVNEAGQTPLMLLLLAPATLPSQRLLQSLLAARADVDARDRRGCTPLFYAVADVGGAPRWKSYVWPLLRAGADPDFQDNEGLTVAGRLEARGVVHVDSVRATSHTGTDVEAVAQPDAATAQARDEAVQEVLRAIALERARPSTAEAIERRRMGLSAEASSCCCIS